MAKLTRLTAKVFGETADGTLADPEIGQFGSAKAGTYNGTGDVATIQSLPAWSNGWVSAVTPTQQFPPLPEMTGVHKVLSYQEAYLLQQGIAEWDSATTYYTNNFCAKNGKIYISQTDENLNNDPESDTVNWREFVSGGGSRNVGEIVASTIPLTDAGLHLLDGSKLLYASYKDFIDYIATLYNSGNYSDIFETEANWQTSVTTYGVCGKFVYDSVNNTVRLPKYNSKIYTGDGTAPVIGNGMALGLTDGTLKGAMISISDYENNDMFTQGYYGVSVGTSTNAGTRFENNSKAIGVTTDASKSGIIVDLSGITTSLDGYYYIVIATSTKTEIEVDIDEIATDLNGKADVDLTNVNNSGTSKGASWSMPSNTYDTLTLGASGTEYTAPSNGWVYADFKKNDQNYASVALYSYVLATRAQSDTGQDDNLTVYLPVHKGDTFGILYIGNVSLWQNHFYFVYAVGSESEYTP